MFISFPSGEDSLSATVCRAWVGTGAGRGWGRGHPALALQACGTPSAVGRGVCPGARLAFPARGSHAPRAPPLPGCIPRSQPRNPFLASEGSSVVSPPLPLALLGGRRPLPACGSASPFDPWARQRPTPGQLQGRRLLRAPQRHLLNPGQRGDEDTGWPWGASGPCLRFPGRPAVALRRGTSLRFLV